MATSEGLERVTVNVKFVVPEFVSLFATVLTIFTVAPSSFVIVPVPVVPPIAIFRVFAFNALNKTVNVSSSSTFRSPITVTFIVLDVSPGAKVIAVEVIAV